MAQILILIPANKPYTDTAVTPNVLYEGGEPHAFDSTVPAELAAANRILAAGAGFDVSTLSQTANGSNFAGQTTFAAGSAASPAIAQTADTDTGLFWPAANELGVAVAGVLRATFTAAALSLAVPIAVSHAGNSPAADIQNSAYSASVKIAGGGSGYTHSHIEMVATGAGRGQGMYLLNTANSAEWFVGQAYNDSDAFYVTRKATATHQGSSADQANRLFEINASGDTGIAGAPSYRLDVHGTDMRLYNASGSANLRIQTGTTTSQTNILFGDANDSDVGLIAYSHSDNSMRFWAGAAEGMRLTEALYLGVGTSAPNRLAHIYESSTATVGQLKVQNAGTGDAAIGFEVTGQNWVIGIDNSVGDAFGIRANTSLSSDAPFLITPGGNVGVGIQPVYRFHVAGSGTVSAVVEAEVGGQAQYMLNTATANKNVIWKLNETTSYLHLDPGSAVTGYYADFDYQWFRNSAGSTAFTFDALNKRLGLGTGSPAWALHALNSYAGATYIGAQNEDAAGQAGVFIDVASSQYWQALLYSSGYMYFQGNPTNSMTFGTVSNTPIYFKTNNLTRATLQADGQMTFAANLTVGTFANPRLYLSNNSGTASTLTLGADSGAGWIGTTTNSSFNLYSNSLVRVTVDADGGVLIGSPTGLSQGAGTINAQGIYDDGAVVTDLVLDQAVTGRFDRHAYQHHPIATVIEDWWFDPDQYAAFWKTNRHLPAIPNWKDSRSKPSIGKLATFQTAELETHAVLIENLNQRIKALESENRALRAAA